MTGRYYKGVWYGLHDTYATEADAEKEAKWLMQRYTGDVKITKGYLGHKGWWLWKTDLTRKPTKRRRNYFRPPPKKKRR